eukprot:CAMPEP_0177773660 /NCGR_PEP_ID=MMETSP0491_2-20121128/13000_1 /TAXON_ID=63592 /ORGANISM="Tetraselmis chuii, Strain PLY429" /LENGTH=78 /DNA_ID=CAMNT_0019291803 /DNA_START=68 /DNA_END=301 /DNA_ORIENTATION=-
MGMLDTQQARRADLEAPTTTGRLMKLFGTTSKHDKHTEASFSECYRLGRVLGCGAFSTVRLAVDLSTGKEWACKVVTE